LGAGRRTLSTTWVTMVPSFLMSLRGLTVPLSMLRSSSIRRAEARGIMNGASSGNGRPVEAMRLRRATAVSISRFIRSA
jgi:hypothetical protein